MKVFCLVVTLFLFSPLFTYGQESQQQVNFDIVQEPFSKFIESAIQINDSSNTIKQVGISQEENLKIDSNDWLQDKTGLDIWGLLKLLGNVLLFVMNLAVGMIQYLIELIQWLLLLIPGSVSTGT